MSQHVTCHVHMFVSIWPVDVVGVMSALVRGLELTELSSSGAATESAAAPTTDSTAAVSPALLSQLPSPAYIHCRK